MPKFGRCKFLKYVHVLAADRGSHELCAILLENGGADVNIQDAEGNTPLQLAVKSRHVYTIKRILG